MCWNFLNHQSIRRLANGVAILVKLYMSNRKDSSLKPLKWYKKLATRKGRLEAGAFLVEGDRALQQILTVQPEAIREILTVAEPLLIYRAYPTRLVTESQLHSICSTRTPQGIATVVSLPMETYSSRLPESTGSKILLLEDIQDPGNIGTLIRTAAAFDFSGIILTEKCADPFSPKCVHSTAGTVLSVWLRRTSLYLELTEVLKSQGFTLIATDLNGTEDSSVLRQQGRLLLALGNEASGISPQILDIADYRLRIHTTREKAESLNVAACGAICMYSTSTAPKER
ncbi:TrmH family RNA methyltransferase [Chloroflexota bacterium]